MEIDCGGFSPKEVFSRSRPSFILWLVMRVGASKSMADACSSEIGLFCLVGGTRQNSNLG